MDYLLIVIGVVFVALVGLLARLRMLIQIGIGALILAVILKYWELLGQTPGYGDIMLGYLIASVVGFFAGYIAGRKQRPVIG